jgi:hypothetical protein
MAEIRTKGGGKSDGVTPDGRAEGAETRRKEECFK